MKILLKTPDEIVKQALSDFDNEEFVNIELQSWQDIIQYDNDINTKIQLRISQKRDGLSENEYHYSISIMIYTNNIDIVAAAYERETKTMSTEELEKLITEVCSIEWDKASTSY